MKLVLIGNGFDLAHGLKTSYMDFYCYNLNTNNGRAFIESLDKLSLKNQNELWSDFENNLGDLVHDNVLDEELQRRQEFNDEFDYGPLDDSHITTTLIKEYYYPLHELDNLVKEWIQSVELMISPLKKFQDIFFEDDKYITFNYTKTLEEVYQIDSEKILHIHGVSDCEPIMGHGRDANLQREYNIYRDPLIEEFVNRMDAEFDEFYKSCKKEITEFIFYIEEFIGTYENEFDEILVLGHSLGKVDIPYFQKINSLLPNLRWRIDYFNESDLKKKEEAIKQLKIKKYELIKI